MWSELTWETAFSVDISVLPESDPLASAVSRLEAARNSAGLDRQSDAISEAIRAAGGDTASGSGYGTGGTAPETSGAEAPTTEAPGGEAAGTEPPGTGDGESNG